ncbi:hypothetical protein EDC04DRAFT_2901250 [Pisolithus marmoratus]|nr:hypothetical protein EDC04DRAFT_2901250 [Pisolithus marmoratus]
MDSDDPLEPHLPIIAALATIIGQSCLELITEEMSSDSTRAQWTDVEKSALISFLIEQKCTGKMGNGAFKPATLNAAAAHLAQLFPNQRGQTNEDCSSHTIQLKGVLRDINQWCNMSGVHWDNIHGANIAAATREEKEVFRSWLQSRPTNSMHHFEGSGWSHLEAMEELFPNDQACGSQAYHPISRPIATCGSTVPDVSSIPSGSGGPGGPGISAPPSHFGSYYGTSTISSSCTSNNPVMTPPILSPPSHLAGPWIGGPGGTLVGTILNEGTVEKAFSPEIVAQSPALVPHIHTPHSLMPPPAFSCHTLQLFCTFGYKFPPIKEEVNKREVFEESQEG